jgi:hypothetical protein
MQQAGKLLQIGVRNAFLALLRMKKPRLFSGAAKVVNGVVLTK